MASLIESCVNVRIEIASDIKRRLGTALRKAGSLEIGGMLANRSRP